MASSLALILRGASEQLSGLCLLDSIAPRTDYGENCHPRCRPLRHRLKFGRKREQACLKTSLLLHKFVVLSYLNSVLWQVRLEGEHLPGVDVGVVGILESLLQLVQLVDRRKD